jgi:hypothetical protein
LTESSAKQEFLDLANKWDNEAASLEQKTSLFQGLEPDSGDRPRFS